MMQKALGAYCLTPVGDLGDDLDVDGEKVLAGHARLARLAGGDDDDVGALDVLVVRGAGDGGVVVAVGRHLHQIEGLALADVLVGGDVQDDDVAELLLRGQHGQDLADLSASDESDLLSHASISFIFGDISALHVPFPGFLELRVFEPIHEVVREIRARGARSAGR